MSPAKPIASTSRRGCIALPTKDLPKLRPSVSFQVETSPTEVRLQGTREGNEDGDQDEEDKSGESMVNMLDILQEYQKKKFSKSSSRVAAIEAKKRIINDACRVETRQIKQEGMAYIEQVKAKVEGLRVQELPPDSAFADVAALFGARTTGVESQLEIISHFLAELSPGRIKLVEDNSADLNSHTAKFEKTGRKIKKKAKNEVLGGLEQQKLATEAQTYIKHYKHLIQNSKN